MSKLIRAAMEELQQGEPYVLGEEASIEGDQIELIEQITDLSYGNQEFELVCEAYTDLMRFDKVLVGTGGQLTLEQGKFVSLMMHHVVAPLDVHTGKAQQHALEALSDMDDVSRFEYVTEGLGDMLGRLWEAIVNFVKKCIDWIKGLFGFGKKSKASAQQKQAEAEEDNKVVLQAVKAKPAEREALVRDARKKLGTTSKITFSPELQKQMDEIKKKGTIKPVPKKEQPVITSANSGERVFVESKNLSYIVPLSTRAQVDHKDVLEGLDRWVKFVEMLAVFNNGVTADVGKLVDATWKSLERARVGNHVDIYTELRREWDALSTDTVKSITNRMRTIDKESGVYGKAQQAVSASHIWGFELLAKAGSVQGNGDRTFFDVDIRAGFHTTPKQIVQRTTIGELVNKGLHQAMEIESRAKDLVNKADALMLGNDEVKRVLARCTDTSKKHLLDSIDNPSAQSIARSFTLPAVNKCVKSLSSAVLALNVAVYAEAHLVHMVALGHAKNLKIGQLDSLFS